MTHDVLPLEAPGAAPRYACILNAQGRQLHDLFLHRTQGALHVLSCRLGWGNACACRRTSAAHAAACRMQWREEGACRRRPIVQ